MKAAFYLILLLPGALGLLALILFGWIFEENIRAEVGLWACAVGLSLAAWLVGFCVLYVLDFRHRVRHMGKRHALLDLAAQALRLRDACSRVGGWVSTGLRLKREADPRLQEKSSEAFARAREEWDAIIPARKALDKRIKEALAGDEELITAYDRDFPKSVAPYDEEIGLAWAGLQSEGPALEITASKMIHVVDEHDKRWATPGSDWKRKATA